MKDYTDIGLGPKMVKTASLAGTRDYTSALDENMRKEPTPYLNRTAIGKGTVQTNLGGVLDLYDKTGGTKVLTYNPSTGVVTILGSLVANQVSTGTYSNIVIAGTNTLSGTLTGGVLAGNTVGSPSVTNGTISNIVIAGTNTLSGTLTGGVLAGNTVGSPSVTNGTINNATFGTPTVIGGTLNPGVYQTQGSAGSAGSIIYVKTVNFAGSAVTLGTLNFSNGLNLVFS